MLYSILVSVDVLIAVALIGLVLIQQGKGAGMGAAFGSGASGTVFGARGSASFLTRITAVLAALFFVNSIILAYLASHRPVTESVIETVPVVQEQKVEVPATAADIPGMENAGSEASELIKEVEEASSQNSAAQTLPADIPQ